MNQHDLANERSVGMNENPTTNHMALHAAGASFVSSAISLVKTIVGAGLLSMPLAYATNGVICGTMIILLAALTS